MDVIFLRRPSSIIERYCEKYGLSISNITQGSSKHLFHLREYSITVNTKKYMISALEERKN